MLFPVERHHNIRSWFHGESGLSKSAHAAMLAKKKSGGKRKRQAQQDEDGEDEVEEEENAASVEVHIAVTKRRKKTESKTAPAASKVAVPAVKKARKLKQVKNTAENSAKKARKQKQVKSVAETSVQVVGPKLQVHPDDADFAIASAGVRAAAATLVRSRAGVRATKVNPESASGQQKKTPAAAAAAAVGRKKWRRPQLMSTMIHGEKD
jgi:hypothetical protein